MEKTMDQRLTELESKVVSLERILIGGDIPPDRPSVAHFNSRALFSSFFELFNLLAKSVIRFSGLIHSLSKEKFSFPRDLQGFPDSNVKVISFDSIRLQTKTSFPEIHLEGVTFEKLDFRINRILLNLDLDTRKVGDILKQQQEILKEELSQIAPDVRERAKTKVRLKYKNDGESTRNSTSR